MFEDLKREVFPAIVERQGRRAAGPRLGAGLLDRPGGLFDRDGPARVPRHRADASAPIQIFATDLGDPASLDKARAGLYPESIEAEVSPERLRRFFVKEDRHYRIQKSVRDLCVFARQNVTVDPPFSRVDLVTLPQRADLHVAAAAGAAAAGVPLRPESRRLPGPRAWPRRSGSFGDLFELTNRTHKIYRQEGDGAAGRS